MFSGTSGAHEMRRHVSSMENRDYVFSWQGFVYMDGVPAGMRSIEKLTEDIVGNLPAAASRLRGVYFVLVHEKRTGKSYAFVDNSGLFHAFYSDSYVSTSFLEIAAAEGLGVADLNPEA